MKLRNAAATGLLIVGFGGASLSAQQPINRPTPPPCCADGRCYANPLAFGWYETRWRRWPIESPAVTPEGEAAQPKSQSDIPSYEVVPKKEEDRKAPLPTTPHEEPIKGPTTTQPQGNGAAPGGATPGGTAPQTPTGPVMPQNAPVDPSATRRLPPYEPQSPGGVRPTTTRPTIPTSELDPPPAMPYGPRSVSTPLPTRQASPLQAAPVRQVGLQTTGAQSDDPPPSLPATLAASLN